MSKIKRGLGLVLITIFMFSFVACGKTISDINKNTKEKKVEENKEIKKEEIKTLYPLTIIDSLKREVKIEEEPQKIISIAPNITEIVFALGASEKLIGRTDYCTYPQEVSKIESIGGMQDPNVEKIVELKPDVVIASTHFKKEILEKLELLGVKVVVLYGEESFDGAYESILKVANILNKNSQADKVVKDMKEKVEFVINTVNDVEKPSVYYVIGYGEGGDYTAGKGTFIGGIIEMAGANNAAYDVDGWSYSLEKLVENDPDILICSNKWDSKTGIQAANGYKDLTAVKEGKLMEIDSDLIQLQGPRLADGLEAMAKLIHPDLFD
ncbi:ABC transporter substrate-binding protein [Clostridium sediminicola]|uniref:ABC transporter substrate-binding protein n=1 Tax=Clostridium sediminicola TaxID=3114879 RepID=UPI0031F1EAB9